MMRSIPPVMCALVLALAAPGTRAEPPPSLPPASPEHLPRWRGFNLLNKFDRPVPTRNRPFDEEDFRLIAELGFNFVRLPMDYRTWIVGNDWRRFDETALRDIDQAVRWGARYGIHVCINFHRAPGHTVASPPEERSLWSDPEAQAVCALHWAMFAKRYRGVPGRNLSFNLFNEPVGVDADTHAAVVRKIAAAIRREDPDRLIICDGLGFGLTPCPELKPLRVAQSLRGYLPFALTHYRADWVRGSDDYARPMWPTPVLGSVVLGPKRRSDPQPMTFIGHFSGLSQVLLDVGWIPGPVTVTVQANGRKIAEQALAPDSLRGGWERVAVGETGSLYANVEHRLLPAAIEPRTTRLTVHCSAGHWLAVREIRFLGRDATAYSLRPWVDASLEQQPVFVKRDADGVSFVSRRQLDRRWLWTRVAAPWKALDTEGIGVMVGEFGCYNKTPHDVTLRWLEDSLICWKQAGWGWALWNFRGPFGPLDSQRDDVEYEDYKGHKLDRKMLDLLQRY